MADNNASPTPFTDFVNDFMTPIVTVYVRKGQSDGTRVMSFRLPKTGQSVGTIELLELGYAIDGNQASMEITSMGRAFSAQSMEVNLTLTEALRREQLALAKFLMSKGYKVQFD